MKIKNFDTRNKVLIVAEIGNNHEGDFETARRLVQAAAEAGVDAVKFQTFKTEHYIGSTDTARFNQIKKYELRPEQFAQLSELARSLKLLFISTPLDLQSVNVLEPLVDAYKVASGDNNFYPLIAHIAQTKKPLIISTGASDQDQVCRTVTFINDQWEALKHHGELGILHCVSSYPVPDENANLLSIPFLKEKLTGTIGYSDHTLNEDSVILAVGLGARIIEKHFTLDKNFSDFRDHKLSADPAGLRRLTQRVRAVENLLGRYEKKIQPCETPLIPVIRRSVVAASDLPAGHTIESADLTWVRPSGGLAPGEEKILIGKVLRRAVQSGEAIKASDAS